MIQTLVKESTATAEAFHTFISGPRIHASLNDANPPKTINARLAATKSRI